MNDTTATALDPQLMKSLGEAIREHVAEHVDRRLSDLAVHYPGIQENHDEMMLEMGKEVASFVEEKLAELPGMQAVVEALDRFAKTTQACSDGTQSRLDGLLNASAAMARAISDLAEAMGAPRMIVNDDEGRPIGVKVGVVLKH